MRFQKVNRPTSSELIIEQIIQSISRDGLKPGDKLPPERELAEMFGVCRASVREAMRAMALMGYLDVYQGKGAFLRQAVPSEAITTDALHQALSAVDSLDLVDIRNILECKIASLAAQRASSEQITAIEQAVLQMEKTVEGEEYQNFQADLAFHKATANASNNIVLLEIMHLLWDRIVKDRDSVLGFGGYDRERCLRTAKAVLDKIKAGDSKGAAKYMSRHLDVVTDEAYLVLQKATYKNGQKILSQTMVSSSKKAADLS